MKRGVHNPAQLDDSDVRARFVVREHELAELVGHLREGDPPRHALVIGQRGMGKSLLLRRLAIAVTDDPTLSERWLPVLMPEELYGVTTLGDLWLAALDHLARMLGDRDLVEQRAALLREPDPARLESLALQRILAAGRSRGRKILLLAENLDMLLDDQVSAEEGWSLRQTLQTEHDLLLVATAVTSFAQVEESGEAFYGFFHRLDLDPLGDDEIRTLWREVNGETLAGQRVVPIRVLSGGNPRLVAVLAQFAHRPNVPGLRESLDLLIDEYTPYFKANIEALPALERKVFSTLADIWAPATSAEVAERARMSSNKVSALLNRLVRRGAVQVVGQESGRQRYELTERLYNLYHLLRRPDGEGRVRALVAMLTHLYEPVVLLRDVLPSIVQATDAAPHSALDTGIASQLGRHLHQAGVWHDLSDEEIRTQLPTLTALLDHQLTDLGPGHPETLLTRFRLAVSTGRLGDAAEAARLLSELVPAQETACGADSDDALGSRGMQALFTELAGDLPAARVLYQALAADLARLVGPDHQATLLVEEQAATVTAALREYDHAAELFDGLATKLTAVRGAADRKTLRARESHALAVLMAADRARAADLIETLIRDATAALGPDDRLTLRASIVMVQERSAPAAATAQALADISVRAGRALGPDDYVTISALCAVAAWRALAGDIDGAQAALADVEARRRDPAGAAGMLYDSARAVIDAQRARAAGEPIPREIAEALASWARLDA